MQWKNSDATRIKDMTGFPVIRTAIPQRRYQYGDFTITLLGDVQSGDDREYQFIAAFVKEGDSRPQLFIVSEHLPPGHRADGSHALRVISNTLDEVMDVDGRWQRQTDFVDQMLQLGGQILGLEQDTPYPLS